MAFTVDCHYDHRAHIVYATFDGVLVSEQEIAELFRLLEGYVRPLRKPAYLVANFDSWRVETEVMRQYGQALRGFREKTQTCFAGHSADIYARMNLRLAAVVGGVSSNLFYTPAEALAFVQRQQQLDAAAAQAVTQAAQPNSIR